MLSSTVKAITVIAGQAGRPTSSTGTFINLPPSSGELYGQGW